MSKPAIHLITGQQFDHEERYLWCSRKEYEKGTYRRAEATCKTCLRKFEEYRRWVKEHGSRI